MKDKYRVIVRYKKTAQSKLRNKMDILCKTEKLDDCVWISSVVINDADYDPILCSAYEAAMLFAYTCLDETLGNKRFIDPEISVQKSHIAWRDAKK